MIFNHPKWFFKAILQFLALTPFIMLVKQPAIKLTHPYLQSGVWGEVN